MNGFITDALWSWFMSWPLIAHVLLIAGVVLFLWGALAGLYSFASKLGGWKAGVGALLALGGVAAALWPRRRVSTEEQYGAPPPIKQPGKKPYKSFFDAFRK